MISNGNPANARSPSASSDLAWSQLSQGMHAAAQPLTILLASLGRTNTHRMNTSELRELTESSAVQVQRVCTLFRHLQQLLLVQSTEPTVLPVSVLPLLTHVVEGVELVFREAGVALSMSIPESCPPVLIDGPRTIRALTSLLVIASQISHATDTVDLILTSTSDFLQIVIRNLRSQIKELDAEASLSLAVAEANMRTQEAVFSLSLQPFRVRIELPRT
jgi:signal transduction histidine kinase